MMKKFAILTCSLVLISLLGNGKTETCRKKLSGIIKRRKEGLENEGIGLIYNRNNEYTMTTLDEDWNVIQTSLPIANFNQDGDFLPFKSTPVSHPGVIVPGQVTYQKYQKIPEVSSNEIGHGLSFFLDEDGDLVGVNIVDGQLMFTYFRQRIDSHSGAIRYKQKGMRRMECNGIELKGRDIVTATGNVNSTHAWIVVKHESESDHEIRTGVIEVSLSNSDTCRYHRFKRILDDVHSFHMFDIGEDVLLVYHDSFMTISRNDLKLGIKSKNQLTFFQCKHFEDELISHVIKYTLKNNPKTKIASWKIVAISLCAIFALFTLLYILWCVKKCCC